MRTFLSRIVPIRNNLSHSNAISIRDAEEVICYSGDFVEGVKEYMKLEGNEREYNVPNIIKINDSLGNEFNLNDKGNESIILGGSKSKYAFRVGEKYSIWLTLDPSFSRSEYRIEWSNGLEKFSSTSEKLEVKFTEDLINENQCIKCKIISNKNWHRCKLWDQSVSIYFKVLPPIE